MYNAFPTHTTAAGGPALHSAAPIYPMDASGVSTGTPAGTAAASSLPAVTRSIHPFIPFNESAADWLTRDTAHPSAPPALRNLAHPAIDIYQLFGLRQVDEYESSSSGGVTPSPAAATDGHTAANAAAGATAAPASRQTAPQKQPRPQSQSMQMEASLFPGDMLEIFGRSGCGKTEFLYQAAISCLLPKRFTSATLDCTLLLGGSDGAVLFFDLDYRFDMQRFITLLQARIRQCFMRHCHTQQQLQQQEESFMQLQHAASWQLAAEESFARFFAHPEYEEFEHYLLAKLYIIRAQTPRQMLASLLECEQLLREYPTAVEHRVTWQMREKERSKAKEASMRHESQHPDNEMKDAENLNHNPSAPRRQQDADPATPTAAAHHIALLCIDNAAAFHWQVKNQRPGYASMAVKADLDSNERRRLSGLPLTETSAGVYDGKGAIWFYELLTQRLRYLMQQYQLCGIATKPVASTAQLAKIHADFSHEEYMSQPWNALMNYRIIIREERDAAPATAATAAHAGASAASSLRAAQMAKAAADQAAERGVLRAIQLKNIRKYAAQQARPGSIGSGSTPATEQLLIRIARDGIRLADSIPL